MPHELTEQVADPFQGVLAPQQLLSMSRVAFGADAGARLDPLAGHGAAEVARRNACHGIVAHALYFSGFQFGINVEDSRRWIAVADVLHKPHWRAHTYAALAERLQVQGRRPRKLGDGISHSFTSAQP